MELGEVREFVRVANTKIAKVARERSFDAPVPFICECGDTRCRGIAFLSLDDFDRMCEQPDRFLVGEAHGHVPAAVVTSASWAPDRPRE
jgi:hypothetical protein